MPGKESDEISLIDLVQFVRGSWRVLLILPVLCALLAAGISLLLPNQYNAKALLLVSAPIGSGGAVSILQSEPVLQQVVDKFQLQQRYRVADAREAKLALQAALKATLPKDKDAPLEVAVTDEDPVQAAAISNYLAATTRQRVLDLHLTEQSKRLYTLQGRLGVAQAQLDAASKALARSVPQREAALDSVATQIISSFAALEAQLAVAAGEQGPQINTVQTSILQIRAELEKANSQIYRLPAEQLAALRNLYFNRAMVSELQKQIQVAKVLVPQDVQIVMPATPPLEKSSPKRSLMVVLAALVGLLLAIGVAVLRQNWATWSQQLRAREAV